ncbi:MAG: hypothetical protein ACREQY_19375, partial [Candidatus Binatia bacterium]
MNILFVRMSQRYIRPETDPYEHRKRTLGSLARRVARRRRLPSLNRGWAPDLLRELIGRGHRATFARLDSRAFMEERLGGRRFVSATVDGGLEAVFTSSASALRGHLEASDAILLREDRLPHEALFADFDAADRPVITILAADARLVSGYRPPTTRFTLLVNSPEEAEACGRLGVSAEVFLKPAARLFYEVPRDAPPKVYDVAQVLHDTGSPRKRFDLFLEGAERLAAIRPGVCAAVVGDAGAHGAKLGHDGPVT